MQKKVLNKIIDYETIISLQKVMNKLMIASSLIKKIGQ
jgi:hypothetical protein